MTNGEMVYSRIFISISSTRDPAETSRQYCIASSNNVIMNHSYVSYYRNFPIEKSNVFSLSDKKNNNDKTHI